MEQRSFAVLALIFSALLIAAPKPKELAQETLQFINDMASNLQVAILNSDKYDLYSCIMLCNFFFSSTDNFCSGN
ncbi:hypothetical protein [Chromobacterium violaceum]|uniref:hypothetical protein n=1 Tax=Chromobacterium violaceum TaxID=536 RepID=UPI0009D99146|nr:hypothetical protein [Chromobacterium violaceum]OQS30411.1 hypothetical protein B0T41_00185 [Chromobacterium violaceum]